MIDGVNIFGMDIKFYGAIIALAFFIGVIIVSYFAKIKGFKKDIAYDLVIILFPLSIIGARIYYVIFSGHSWTIREIIAINSGGLAIYGGVIAGFFGVVIYSKIKKLNILKLADIIAPALILGQSLGRWGNFFNQEAYGAIVENTKLQFFPYAVFIDQENAWHMATFFYESIWNLLGFAVLFYMLLKIKNNKGHIMFAYLIFYGVGRYIIEGFRTDSLFVAHYRVSQLLSLLLIFVGISFYIYRGYICYKDKKAKENIK